MIRKSRSLVCIRSRCPNGVVILLLTLIILLLLAACANETPENTQMEISPASTPVPLQVCTSSSTINGAAAHYASANGIFDKYGLDVQLLGVDGGPDAVRALLSGQMDLCQISGPAVINANLVGADLAIIGGIINQQLYSLMVTPDIKTAADLKGKSLAVSEPGSASDSILKFGLQQLGLDPNQDVIIVSVGNRAARIAAMEAGSVAGTVVAAPESGRAKTLGFKAMLTPEDMQVPHQHTAVVVRKEYLSENPEIATNFIKAISEAIYLMKRDRQGTVELMTDVLLLDPVEDRDVIDEAYEVVILETMDERLPVNRDGVQLLIENGRQENPNALDLTVDDIVDERIIQELTESGFFDQLGK